MTRELPIVAAVKARPRDERLTLLRELMAEFAARDGLTVLPTPDGRYVSWYTAPAAGWRPPVMSPTERAELQLRLATPNDTLTADEITADFRRWGQETTPPPG